MEYQFWRYTRSYSKAYLNLEEINNAVIEAISLECLDYPADIEMILDFCETNSFLEAHRFFKELSQRKGLNHVLTHDLSSLTYFILSVEFGEFYKEIEREVMTPPREREINLTSITQLIHNYINIKDPDIEPENSYLTYKFNWEHYLATDEIPL